MGGGPARSIPIEIGNAMAKNASMIFASIGEAIRLRKKVSIISSICIVFAFFYACTMQYA